jgi:primosomal protein N' (replication factor Y)
VLYEVAVRTPLRKLFTYESDVVLARGTRVKVPFRSREVVGFIWREAKEKPKGLKAVSEVFEEEAFFDEKTLLFYERAANYYGISLGELLASSLPKKVRDGKELKVPEEKVFAPQLVELSEKQRKVADDLLNLKGFSTALLMGETGSGKTEIYLELMERVIKEKGQVLFLVPEISLTPQLENRISSRLGTQVSVFHSQIKESKRGEVFARARLGMADVFVGARSSLFLPFKDLRLIIIDEEHDHSFKQSERGPYNARDLSILRAHIFKHPVVLGSATPSIETYSKAKESKEPIHYLPPYFEKKPPEISVIDLKKTWKDESRSFITDKLNDAIVETLEKGEQTLLFLNRRGSASQRTCIACGSSDECKNCSCGLTIHEDLNSAVCHWCGYQEKIKRECVSCGEKEFFVGGIGTKEIENQIKERFPEARVARIDRDKVQKKDVLANTLKKFADGEIDILVGTQMISKGIDIPKLSLVGVILADLQLAGRAGRRGQDSKFIIQTFNVDHPLYEWLRKNDVEYFIDEEVKIRKMAQMPPYSKLSLWMLSHRDERRLQMDAQNFFNRINSFANSLSVENVGPTFAPMSRWKGVYRMQILSRTSPKGHMSTFITAVLDDLNLRPLKSKIKLDRDPYQFV